MGLFGRKCLGVYCGGYVKTVGGLFGKKNYGDAKTPLCENCWNWIQEKEKREKEKSEQVIANCHFCGKTIRGGEGYYKCTLFEGVDPRGNRVEPTNADCKYLGKPKCMTCASGLFGNVCTGCNCSMQKCD